MRIPRQVAGVAAVLSIFLQAGGALAADPAPLINPTGAAAPPNAPAVLTPQSGVDEVLDALDRRGQNLKGFDAKVEMTETDAALGLESTRTGRVWFQKKAGDDTRIRVLLDQ